MIIIRQLIVKAAQLVLMHLHESAVLKCVILALGFLFFGIRSFCAVLNAADRESITATAFLERIDLPIKCDLLSLRIDCLSKLLSS